MKNIPLHKKLLSSSDRLRQMVAILVLTCGALSASAATGSGTIAVRGDVVGTNSYTDPANNTQPGSSYLELQYARARFEGKAMDHYSGILVMDFLQTVTTPAVGASSSPDILKVYEVDDALTDNLSVGIGRLLDPGTGGHESLKPFYDNWFFSQSYNANFPLGIQVDYAISDSQKVKLLVLNQGWDDGSLGGKTNYSSSNTQMNNSASSSTAAGSTSNSQTQLGYGARYMGTFGGFDVLGSYHVAPTSGYKIYNGAVLTESGNNTNNYAVLGVGYRLDGFRVTVDYTNIMFNGIGTQNLDSGSKNTLLLMAEYKIGSFMPRLKVESTAVSDVPGAYFNPNGNIANWWGDTSTTLFGAGNTSNVYGPSGGYSDQITRIDVGCDYRHNIDDPFYYSVHYISSTQSFSGSGLTTGFKNTNIYESAIYLSMIGKADLFGK